MPDLVWSPPTDLKRSANVTRFMHAYGIRDVDELVSRSIAEREWFWGVLPDALGIEWSRRFHTVRDMSRGAPWTDWYVGGTLNLTSNCITRHARGPRADEVALTAEDESGASVSYTFAELDDAVARCAGALLAAGVERGDRVAAYMPMGAEVVIQMFAAFRIGAIFIPIFSGYGPGALAERLRDAEAKLLFTAQGTTRRGKAVPILPNAETALKDAPSVQTVVVSLEEFMAGATSAETVAMASMDPALILYTSGTTGRPKGTVHSHAGTLVQVAKEVGFAFDMKPEDNFFWLTDIGWMMGPWMLIGGLFHGATVHVYDGAWDYPEPDRLWRMLADRKISVFGISPTAIRLAMRAGKELIERHDLSKLRILGSTGEPWDEVSWAWYFETVGGRRCPVINISGGTDIIGCFLSPLPLHSLKPCSLVGPGLGMPVDVWNENGEPVRGEVGYLVCTEPTPSMTRGIWNDPERYLESYWSKWPNVWNHGDWAWIDEDGQWFIQGRADDTLKVAGRRIGPAEVEGALMATGKIVEAAAVGVPHEIKGEAIVCFAVPKPDVPPSEDLRKELVDSVVQRLGKIDRPEKILFVSDLPKTRSAKVLRRLVKKAYLGEELGDLSSLQNPEAVDAIGKAT
jgi:acetyl-CoA synthetase